MYKNIVPFVLPFLGLKDLYNLYLTNKACHKIVKYCYDFIPNTPNNKLHSSHVKILNPWIIGEDDHAIVLFQFRNHGNAPSIIQRAMEASRLLILYIVLYWRYKGYPMYWDYLCNVLNLGTRNPRQYIDRYLARFTKINIKVDGIPEQQDILKDVHDMLVEYNLMDCWLFTYDVIPRFTRGGIVVPVALDRAAHRIISVNATINRFMEVSDMQHALKLVIQYNATNVINCLLRSQLVTKGIVRLALIHIMPTTNIYIVSALANYLQTPWIALTSVNDNYRGDVFDAIRLSYGLSTVDYKLHGSIMSWQYALICRWNGSAMSYVNHVYEPAKRTLIIIYIYIMIVSQSNDGWDELVSLGNSLKVLTPSIKLYLSLVNKYIGGNSKKLNAFSVHNNTDIASTRIDGHLNKYGSLFNISELSSTNFSKVRGVDAKYVMHAAKPALIVLNMLSKLYLHKIGNDDASDNIEDIADSNQQREFHSVLLKYENIKRSVINSDMYNKFVDDRSDSAQPSAAPRAAPAPPAPQQGKFELRRIVRVPVPTIPRIDLPLDKLPPYPVAQHPSAEPVDNVRLPPPPPSAPAAPVTKPPARPRKRTIIRPPPAAPAPAAMVTKPPAKPRKRTIIRPPPPTPIRVDAAPAQLVPVEAASTPLLPSTPVEAASTPLLPSTPVEAAPTPLPPSTPVEAAPTPLPLAAPAEPSPLPLSPSTPVEVAAPESKKSNEKIAAAALVEMLRKRFRENATENSGRSAKKRKK